MTPPHWHLIMNHIPVIGIWFGIVFFIIGFLGHKEIMAKAALWILLILALISIPTFMTGQPAHEFIDKLPVISHDVIHEHQETAELAFISILVVGGLSLLGLLIPIFTRKRPAWISFLLLLASIITAVLMALTANTGGLIRHPEIKSGITQAELLQDYEGYFSPDTTGTIDYEDSLDSNDSDSD